MAAARAAAEADARALSAMVAERFVVGVGPLGDVMLLPRPGAFPGGEAPDPATPDTFDWSPVREAFAARHGRPPAAGARALAARLILGP